MKKQFVFIAIAALILPAILRGFWFYRGVPNRPEIATPDFTSFVAPEAPVNSPSDAGNEIEQLNGTVVLDLIHGNQFYMNEIESLTQAIKERGGVIESLIDTASLEYQLKYASAFITVSPSVMFNTLEIQALHSFVERGGKVIVFTDATRNIIYYDYISGNPIAYGDADAANSLLAGFGISINNDYLYNTETNEGNFRNIIFDDFGKSELTFGLKEVALYGARSVESNSGLILLEGTESTRSSANDVHNPGQGGAALSENENVAAFGDFTFLTSPYNGYTDNATLIANLADFALSGSQTLTLSNFPFLFNADTVQVFVSPELTKTTELIGALSGLQTSLRYMNVDVEFVSDVPRTGDAIIIGSYALTEDTEAFANKFDVTIDEGEVISTVEFGDVGRYGNGILMFDAGTKGNTLVMLADTPEDLVSLIGVVSSGSTFSCLTSDKVAVCGVGFGGDYYSESDGETLDDGTTTEEGSTDGTEPEVTATPAG